MCEPAAPQALYKQLVAVTDRRLCPRPLPQQVERIARLHPHALILREKDLPEADYEDLAAQVLDICRARQVLCILHSHPAVARSLGCTALHLPLPLLRQEQAGGGLADFAVVGASVHSVQEALEAQSLGATYLTAGHIFATDCKKGLPPRGLDFLRQVCQAVALPVYGIGGIRPDPAQLQALRRAGAAGGCCMSAMMRL